MNELITKLNEVIVEFYRQNCGYNCNECPLGKPFNPDIYDDKTMCDILNDTFTYLEENGL